MNLSDRVALVTGGAHRVGRALVLALARAGADLVLHYHAAEDEAAATAAEVEALGRRAVALRADLSDPDQATALGERAARALGRLDVLVNSAALFESGSFLDVTAADWDRVMAVNARAPFLLLQATARHLAASKGVAVNIADVSGLRPWTGFPHHSISKAALIHLTRLAARSLAPDVRVNCIVPGTVLPPEDYTEEQRRESARRTVLERTGSPQDVEDALMFLVRSEFATGSVVVVDGGRMLK
ncbi:MAG: SDR family NAD(P)-dependent oxidoreductase [Gemmatimonadota bacterium]